MALRLQKKDYRSDGELLRSYRLTGNLEILGALYSRYIDLVYGVCLRYFKNREMSQDTVMEIFEKLIKELEKHHVNNFRSWLYVLTRNYCLMKLRSSQKDISITVNIEDNEYLFMENNRELHPIDRGYSKEEALENCIEQLKEEQRECIRLFYYENKCYREIAEKMNINEKKVKSNLQNAKRNLKICMDSDNEKQ